MSILGAPTATREKVVSNLPAGTHSRFRETMLPALWVAAVHYGIDPVGMVAQAGKETAWGNFPGKVRPEFHNTCGLKLHTSQQALFPGVTDGDNPLAHALFASFKVGAEAHAQHLMAYCGQPVSYIIVDPRFHLVGPPAAVKWSDLNGRWAPAADYGSSIEAIIRTLAA